MPAFIPKEAIGTGNPASGEFKETSYFQSQRSNSLIKQYQQETAEHGMPFAPAPDFLSGFELKQISLQDSYYSGRKQLSICRSFVAGVPLLCVLQRILRGLEFVNY